MATTLDTKGFNCPLPVLKTKKVMKNLAAGERITVLATDPSSVKDFEAFYQATGDRLVDSSEENGVFTYIIEKAG